jgi:hypothetical protein
MTKRYDQMNTNTEFSFDASRAQLPEFVNYLIDQIPRIERGIARLRRKPTDDVLLAELRNDLSRIREDAELARLELGVQILRMIEELLQRVGQAGLPFNDLFAEVVLLAMDRLELAVEAMSGNRPISQLKLGELSRGLAQLAGSTVRTFEQDAIRLIEAVTGFRPVLPSVAIATPVSAIARSSEQVASDLLFFRLLTKQHEARSSLFKGRRQRLLQLALDTNEEAGRPVDPVQLEAAVYMHDIGMMFLPESLWLKTGNLSEEERFQMQVHPTMAAGLLERMEGWQPAAEMVAQHHEMPDGGGYPRRLKGNEICHGAKILSIVDAFEAVTLKHSDRGMSRSVLRAIAEVNACDKQFAVEWIEPFNAVIRRMLEN